MQYAVLDAQSRVVNIAVADASWQPGPGLTKREATDGCVIGGRWTGSAWEAPPAPPRILDAVAFRDLFTDVERISVRKADDRLADAELLAMAQDSVNLDSPRTAQLLALAVARGAITRARADAVLAGVPPV